LGISASISCISIFKTWHQSHLDESLLGLTSALRNHFKSRILMVAAQLIARESYNLLTTGYNHYARIYSFL
jgi:hypothetical protein